MNKKTVLHAALLILTAALFGANAAYADDHGAYWTGASGKMWRTGSGECWRPGNLPSEGKDCGMVEEVEVLDSDGDGVPDDLDKCPGTPAGVEVDADGCPLDSDGDGVPDYLDKCPGTPAGTVVDADGCPITGTKLFTIEDVNFDFDSATLRPEAEATLQEALQKVQDNGAVDISIIGHTDSIGSEAYNQGLSERRAQSVADYMTNNGADASKLSVEGHGETDPVADNSTKEGRAQNRRVDFVVK
jgi:OOP family OmpA-OmpF porin